MRSDPHMILVERNAGNHDDRDASDSTHIEHRQLTTARAPHVSI